MSQRADRKPSTLKRMIWTIVGTLALIAVIAGVKVLLVVRMIHSMPAPAPVTVSTVKAAEQPWQPSLAAIGSLRAVKGADLGGTPDQLVLDLNFAYPPSCAYDEAWACPLPGPGNTLTGAVPVGELSPA